MAQALVGGQRLGVVGRDDPAEVEDDAGVGDRRARTWRSARRAARPGRSSRPARGPARRSASTISGARPRDGSSSSRTVGLASSARPTTSICRSPPDSVCAALRLRRAVERREAARRPRSMRSSASACPCGTATPSRRFSSTVSSAMTPRPSGTCAMPLPTIASTGDAGDVLAVEHDAAGLAAARGRRWCAAASSCRRRSRRGRR